jgi:hypothetical protein
MASCGSNISAGYFDADLKAIAETGPVKTGATVAAQ